MGNRVRFDHREGALELCLQSVSGELVAKLNQFDESRENGNRGADVEVLWRVVDSRFFEVELPGFEIELMRKRVQLRSRAA